VVTEEPRTRPEMSRRSHPTLYGEGRLGIAARPPITLRIGLQPHDLILVHSYPVGAPHKKGSPRIPDPEKRTVQIPLPNCPKLLFWYGAPSLGLKAYYHGQLKHGMTLCQLNSHGVTCNITRSRGELVGRVLESPWRLRPETVEQSWQIVDLGPKGAVNSLESRATLIR